MAKQRITGRLMFHKVPVEIHTPGPLHATSPQNPEGIRFMLARQPSEAVLEARRGLGEPITPLDELEKQVSEETRSEEKAPQRAVFRRDQEGRVFLHDNFVIGHLRNCAKAISRAIGFWGFEGFINETLFVRPQAIYFQGQPEVKVEEWPTHFDIYRMGRVSSFRQAEYVEDSRVSFNLVLVNDPRWTKELLGYLFEYGSGKGWGGGRGRRMGTYKYTLGSWQKVPPEEAWQG